jgi:hypothetical protein
MPVNVKTVRDRAWHSLSPQTAAAAGMTLAQLQQFVAGSFHPTPEQIETLSRHMGLTR